MNRCQGGWTKESLLELAALSGIATEYHDVSGRLCRPSFRALQKILESMGHREPKTSLAYLRGRPLNRLLEPCMAVFHDEQPVTITLHIPCPEDREEDLSLVLSLSDEDGTELETRTIKKVVCSGVASHEGQRFIRVETLWDVERDCGYYEIEARTAGHGGEIRGSMLLIVAPRRCHMPGIRTWGLTLSLYGIRSEQNWGIGDLGDLSAIMGHAHELGAGFVGVNPLHATPYNPQHGVSPYQPISRLYLNYLYARVPGLMNKEPLEAKGLRDNEMVDYEGVSALKLRALKVSFDDFVSKDHANGEMDDFQNFCQEEGGALDDFATYMALAGFLEATGKLEEPQRGWGAWPQEYHDPCSSEVEAFKAEHEQEVLFEKYIQWVLSSQLERASKASQHMPLGLYGDLAVGSLAGGSDAWAFGQVFAEGMNMGAPPDNFSPFGQNWLFPPLVPDKLRETGYRLFIQTLRKNMRHFAALRIDHALGLFRTFWIPEGMGADEGTYVSCPHEEMLKIIALESMRSNTVIIAEDLGTIGQNMRETLASYGMLSYRLLYFERNWEKGEFLPPEAYPDNALAAVNSHDLPTLGGFWKSSDIRERQSLGLYADDRALGSALEARDREKQAILRALQPYLQGIAGPSVDMDSLLLAAHSFIAKAPSLLAAMSLDDVMALAVQQNLPGVDKGHPNWMRKYPLGIESIFGPGGQAPLLRKLVTSFRKERG